MTLNERVFRQNINNRPSIVVWTYLSIYSYFIIYGYVGYFKNYLIENIQLWMLYGPWATLFTHCVDSGFPKK